MEPTLAPELTVAPQPATESVALIGPALPTYKVWVEGVIMPYLTVMVMDDGQWNISLDDRFALIAPEEEAKRWLAFMANGMAVAAGYTCIGLGSRPLNRYK